MNRYLTTTVRLLMDNLLPPLIRDSRWFMYPFYLLAYRGRSLNAAMNFKRNVYGFSREDYVEFYSSLDSISRNRETDLNGLCMRRVLETLDPTDQSVLDVGCGNGYLLKCIHERFPELTLAGCDVKKPVDTSFFEFVSCDVARLPFADKSFDVVSCCHTLEHLLELPRAWEELKRVARRELAIVVPRQRYYYYTLDEHVNFFPDEASLVRGLELNHEDYVALSLWGDWFIRVRLNGRDADSPNGAS